MPAVQSKHHDGAIKTKAKSAAVVKKRAPLKQQIVLGRLSLIEYSKIFHREIKISKEIHMGSSGSWHPVHHGIQSLPVTHWGSL